MNSNVYKLLRESAKIIGRYKNQYPKLIDSDVCKMKKKEQRIFNSLIKAISNDGMYRLRFRAIFSDDSKKYFWAVSEKEATKLAWEYATEHKATVMKVEIT